MAYPRSPEVSRSRFDQTFASARSHVESELENLGATNVIISTNCETSSSGSLKATTRQPEDTGVAVYFTMDGQEKVLCCDAWDRVHDNLRAIGLTLEYLRAVGRWQVSQVLDNVFRGFVPELPETATGGDVRPLHEILGIAANAPQHLVKKAIRAKRLEVHPDRNNNDRTKWDELESAIKIAGLQ